MSQLPVVSPNISQPQAVTSQSPILVSTQSSSPTVTIQSSILTTMSHPSSQLQATPSQSLLLDVNTFPFVPPCRTPDPRSHQITSTEAERVLDELQNFDDLYGWDQYDDQQGDDGWDRYDDLQEYEEMMSLDASMYPLKYIGI